MTYRVALVGAGHMGARHSEQWKLVPDAEIVGVLDTRPDAARAIAQSYTDWDTMIAQAKPDIVDICTPTPRHREYVEKGAAAGLAMFVEKPLARTLADCAAIVAAIDRANVPAMVGHVVRYFPEYATATELTRNGEIGKPAAIRTARMAGFPSIEGRENWYADPKQSGGVVLDMILHDFDWLRWTFGPVIRVFATGLFGTPHYDARLDYALVTLKFESGAVGHVTGSWAHPGSFRTTLEIAGDAGVIEHDSAAKVPLNVNLRQKAGYGPGVAVPESPMLPIDDPYFKELNAFLHALKIGTTPPVTVHDAYEAVRIALAALESIETGKAVTL